MGGGFFAIGGRSWFYDCTFDSNFASYAGGAGWWNRASGEVYRCVFVNNYALVGAGALLVIYTENHEQPDRNIIRDTVFKRNTSYDAAALLLLRNSVSVVSNCLFTDNIAENHAAGMYVAFDSTVTADNLTFSDNLLLDGEESGGSAIYVAHNGSLALTNSIIANNKHRAAVYIDETADTDRVAISFCDFHNNTPDYGGYQLDIQGTGNNIFTPPRFIENYRLCEPSTGDPDQVARGRSSCVDAGSCESMSTCLAAFTTRTDERLDRGLTDMGYHHSTEMPFIINPVPAPGESNVGMDTDISFQILDYNRDFIPASITIDISGMPVLFTWESTEYGAAVIYDPEIVFEECETVPIHVTGYDQAGNTLVNGDYTFTTAGCPDIPEIPLYLTLHLSDSVFMEGDRLYLACDVVNQAGSILSCNLHCLLDIFGSYYFFPSWTAEYQYTSENFETDEFRRISLLDIDILPDVADIPGMFYFYAAILDTPNRELLSNISVSLFSFQ